MLYRTLSYVNQYIRIVVNTPFSWSVCIYMYIYWRTGGGPCPLLILCPCRRVCWDAFSSGDTFYGAYFHQCCTLSFISMGLVALGNCYAISCRVYSCINTWSQRNRVCFNADAHLYPTPLFVVTLFKTNHLIKSLENHLSFTLCHIVHSRCYTLKSTVTYWNIKQNKIIHFRALHIEIQNANVVTQTTRNKQMIELEIWKVRQTQRKHFYITIFGKLFNFSIPCNVE